MWKIPDDKEHKNKRLEELAESFSQLMSHLLSDGLPQKNIVYEIRLLKHELLEPISWKSYIDRMQKEGQTFEMNNLYNPGDYFSKN